MRIDSLRKLVRTGEYLERNMNDSSVRNQWLFDVEEFLDSLDPKYSQRVFHAVNTLKTFSSSMRRDMDRVRRENIGLIMGLLRSLYNKDTSENKPLIADSQAVFIVHGHDDGLIQDVKGVVSRLGLMPIVLREQPDRGQTIIEKLEDWLGNCKCAIVLYTPCDVGKGREEEAFERRARQNVVYEHGLFQGYLGRKRIVVLRKKDTVIPGDCSGLVYVSVDDEGWQVNLEKNISAIDR